MKQIYKHVSSQARLLAAVVVAAIVGGAATAVVSASIPDSSGTIHGCYTSKGALSVIDTDAGQTCKTGTTPLNWSTSGGGSSNEPVGYAYVILDFNTGQVSMDASRSMGVSNFVNVNGRACITFATAPKTFAVTSVGETPSSSMGAIKDSNGWFDDNSNTGGSDNGTLCDQNAPGSNAWFAPNGNNGTGMMTVF